MTNHLSPEILAALADRELQPQELAAAQEHLAGCGICTSNALAQALLKSATARAGQRFATPADLTARLSRQIAQEAAKAQGTPSVPTPLRERICCIGLGYGRTPAGRGRCRGAGS